MTRWRNTRLLFMLPLLIAIPVYAATLDGNLRPSDDSAIYIGLAHSLAQKSGYVDAYSGMPHGKFPPLFPVLLSTLYVLSNSQWILLFKALQIVLILTSCILLLYILHVTDNSAGGSAHLIASLFSIAPITVRMSTFVLSDLLFTTIMLVSITLFTALLSSSRQAKWYIYPILGVTLLLLVLTRLAGLLFVLSVLSWFIFWRRVGVWNLLSTVGPSTVVGMWWIWRSAHIDGDERAYVLRYSDGLADLRSALTLLASLLSGAKEYVVTHIPYAIVGQDLPMPLAVGLCSALFVGIWACSQRTGLRLPEVAVLTYLGGLFLWPSQSSRFLLPVVGLTMWYSTCGATWFARRVTGWFLPRLDLERKLLALTVVLLLASNAMGTIRLVHAESSFQGDQEIERQQYDSLVRAGRWLQEQMRPEEVIMSNGIEHLYIALGMRGLAPKTSMNEQQLFEYIREKNVTYIVITAMGRSYMGAKLIDVMRERPENFELVFECCAENEVVVLRVVPSKGKRRDGLGPIVAPSV